MIMVGDSAQMVVAESSDHRWVAAGSPGPVYSYKLRYIVAFGLVEMAISTNPNPRNLYENTATGSVV